MFDKEEFLAKIKNFVKENLGLTTNDFSYFEKALTHKSCHQKNPLWNKQGFNYEAQEFLGDSLINWVISKSLFSPEKTVGDLDAARQQMIQSKSLVLSARGLGLDKLIRVGKSLASKNISDAIIEDVFEAWCGAIYLTFGMDEAEKFIKQTVWKNFLDKKLEDILDYKTLLQNAVHKKYKTKVTYTSKHIGENKNDSLFEVTCFIEKNLTCKHISNNIKFGEKECAKFLFLKYFNA